uniref:Uncharacterized protein n=1 Tax=Sphaerodactylus townsendi TaxID=933632 RepID=A0ACB8EVY0_9SAUR
MFKDHPKYEPSLAYSITIKQDSGTDFCSSSKAYLVGIVDIVDDEGLLNLSSILSTFIILFLVSIFYGATVTVIKVK